MTYFKLPINCHARFVEHSVTHTNPAANIFLLMFIYRIRVLRVFKQDDKKKEGQVCSSGQSLEKTICDNLSVIQHQSLVQFEHSKKLDQNIIAKRLELITSWPTWHWEILRMKFDIVSVHSVPFSVITVVPVLGQLT